MLVTSTLPGLAAAALLALRIAYINKCQPLRGGLKSCILKVPDCESMKLSCICSAADLDVLFKDGSVPSPSSSSSLSGRIPFSEGAGKFMRPARWATLEHSRGAPGRMPNYLGGGRALLKTFSAPPRVTDRGIVTNHVLEPQPDPSRTHGRWSMVARPVSDLISSYLLCKYITRCYRVPILVRWT